MACSLPKPVELASPVELEKEKDAIDAKLKKISNELQPVMVRTHFIVAIA